MSGGSIAYHLRENKAIERNLFVDLLARIGRVENISDYTYTGFGGPFLEDFKTLHSALRIAKMISIEADGNVCKRQEFNSPAQFIQLKHETSGDFLRSHEFSGRNIVWFDYTSPSDLYVQLSELRTLVGKLGCFDVAKITLNANPAALGGKLGTDLHTTRVKILTDRLGDHCKQVLEEDDVLPSKYPSTLLHAIHGALGSLATRASGEYFQILSAFVYKDGGHQMLTVTGIVLNAKEPAVVDDFFDKSRVKHWPFHNTDWSAPLEISVPSLSTKERITLDSALPAPDAVNWGDYLCDHLGYCPSETTNVEAIKDQLVNYAKFYRAYPLFSRVVL